MILFNKAYCQIHYYSESNTVHLDWNKQSSFDQFTTACNFALNLLQETGSTKMIADNSKVNVVAIQCQNWLTEQWFPQAIARGFQYSAVIVSDDAFVKFAVKRIENKIENQRFVVQYFNDVELAKKWLADIDQETKETIALGSN